MLSGVVMAVTGCGAHLALTGKPASPIAKESVRIYLKEKPTCQYEEVGLLEVRGGAFSMDSLFTAWKEKAAQVGADGVKVSQIDKNGLGEYRGTAVAIRCKPA
jgi:hypothetical protein